MSSKPRVTLKTVQEFCANVGLRSFATIDGHALPAALFNLRDIAVVREDGRLASRMELFAAIVAATDSLRREVRSLTRLASDLQQANERLKSELDECDSGGVDMFSYFLGFAEGDGRR